MAKKKKHHSQAVAPATPGKSFTIQKRVDRPHGIKLLSFRFIAAMLIPLAFLLALELLLRVAGFGYSASFIQKMRFEGRTLLVQNDCFGWRFFGSKYARTPIPFAIDRKTPEKTIRIFVMGESAALGDPQPEFGLPRMLDAMLSLRYPSTHFEVVNVAMTAINSHTIREIAKDCAKADGDIWVLYIGNNEVVGPFGGGTVFGPQAPSLASIHANLFLKTTRLGQLLDAARNKMKKGQTEEGAWGGMMMFLDQQVTADDPRMQNVYKNFQSNIEDIIDYGRESGSAIALCNIAVNLKDCAPFASQLSPTTDQQMQTQWQEQYQKGIELEEKGQWADALAAYEEAEAVDSHYAELHYRKAQCALGMNDEVTALSEFSRARDLDTLRFRSDRRMSEILKTVAEKKNDTKVRFVDAEAALAAESPDGIPGKEFFYDHVHLTWEGNWRLARSVAEQLEDLLPASVKNDPNAQSTWPSSEQCAERLAWTDRERFKCLTSMRGRLEDPPFTSQLNHAEQIHYLNDSITRLESAAGAVGLQQTLQACEKAIVATPDDPTLLARLAVLRMLSGDHAGAVRAARKTTTLLPHNSAAWDRLATVLVESDLLPDAIEAYKHALHLEKNDVFMRHHYAQACVRAGNPDEAMKQWKKVIKLQPKFGPAYLYMGKLLESQGKTSEATELYRKAVVNPVNRSAELAELGKLCLEKGWYSEAMEHLQNAALQSPTDAAILYDLASALQGIGRDKEAAEQLALARRYDTSFWVEKFQKGVEYGRQGQPEKAVSEFQEVVRLQPDLMEGHLNLAIALASLNRTEEAASEFQQVLRLDPENPQAINYLTRISEQAP
ncbi:MAG: tetratricopeptide repeat protein [Pontiellaceae bacterium]|nr:tetratricopeptide repeat protein [Pontiellaceae bacterium]